MNMFARSWNFQLFSFLAIVAIVFLVQGGTGGQRNFNFFLLIIFLISIPNKNYGQTSVLA